MMMGWVDEERRDEGQQRAVEIWVCVVELRQGDGKNEGGWCLSSEMFEGKRVTEGRWGEASDEESEGIETAPEIKKCEHSISPWTTQRTRELVEPPFPPSLTLQKRSCRLGKLSFP